MPELLETWRRLGLPAEPAAGEAPLREAPDDDRFKIESIFVEDEAAVTLTRIANLAERQTALQHLVRAAGGWGWGS